MRESSFQDCLTVLRHHGVDPAAGAAIDVGGTRTVTLRKSGGMGVAANPLLEVNPGTMFLDQGFNAGFIGANSDLEADFLDPAAIAPWRGRFDLVFSFDTLEHIPNPFLFCEHLAAVARPGGHIYLATVFQYVYHPSPEDYYRFSPPGLRECFLGPLNPARSELSELWCDWESDGDGVAILLTKGPARPARPLSLPRRPRPSAERWVQRARRFETRLRSLAGRLRGKF